MVIVRCPAGFRPLLLLLSIQFVAAAQPFHLPTANRALFEPDGGERFFVGTVGKPWTSGAFGCTRTDGWQFHEGLDIRSIQKDKRGEPTDPVLSTADGTVVYVNRKASLSTYGIYVMIRHEIEGLEVYSLYAHLSAVRDGLGTGTAVRAGEEIATMGRTANTAQGISKDRAHVHFELALLLNDKFESWHRKHYPGQRNDHGRWNGRNLLGLDPQEILLTQEMLKDQFSLVTHVRRQRELMRVRVRETNVSFARRYPLLVRRYPPLDPAVHAGYEIAFNFNGVPFDWTPLRKDQMPGKGRVELVSVNEQEREQYPCGKLVARQGAGWRLTATGERLIDLLLY